LVVHIILEYGFKNLLTSFILFSLFLSAIYFYQFISNYSEFNSLKNWDRIHAFDGLAATMGHKNLLSSIQFLTLPLLIYTITTGKKIWKALGLIAVVLIALTFLQTQTRAVFVAIFISIISFLLINNRIIQFKHIILLFSSFIFAMIIGYSILHYSNRLESFKTEFKGILTDSSLQSRYKLYSSTLQLMAENPILGVGPGNWKVEVWQYGLYFESLGKSFAQRPHNDFLWVFAEGGVFAGLSYILIFLILLRDSYLLHKNRTEEDGVIHSLLFATVMGFGFISLVDFPMERFSHNVIFFVLAAIIIAGRLRQIEFTKEKLPTWVTYLFLFITCFSVYVASIRYNGEIHAANAIHYKSKGNWNYVIKAIDKAHNPIYYEMENTSTPLLWYRGVAYFNQQKYDLALKDFKEAYKTNPYHVHVLNNLATSYQMKGDSKMAKKYYRDVFEVNPTFKESRINLAAILYNEKNYVEALDVILQSKVDPYWKRKKQNFSDNYDLYLKTIVNSWIKSVYTNATENERKVLNAWKLSFDKKPQHSATKLTTIFEKREKDKVGYLEALMLSEEDYKNKKNGTK
jgi:O-antigen ligase/Tfp pilus assembly protein PilF